MLNESDSLVKKSTLSGIDPSPPKQEKENQPKETEKKGRDVVLTKSNSDHGKTNAAILKEDPGAQEKGVDTTVQQDGPTVQQDSPPAVQGQHQVGDIDVKTDNVEKAKDDTNTQLLAQGNREAVQPGHGTSQQENQGQATAVAADGERSQRKSTAGTVGRAEVPSSPATAKSVLPVAPSRLRHDQTLGIPTNPSHQKDLISLQISTFLSTAIPLSMFVFILFRFRGKMLVSVDNMKNKILPGEAGRKTL